MPPLPTALTVPGWLIAILLIGGIILVTAATLVSALRRRSGEGQSWGKAFSGARERQRLQAAQMDELHRVVTDLTRPTPKSDPPNE